MDGAAGALRQFARAAGPGPALSVPAFTSNVAALLRRREGPAPPGADADLVVLDAAGAVGEVMARGCWHVRDGRPVVRGTFEP
jgi:beta-aspartyl-dipeptidase (metallo-type)